MAEDPRAKPLETRRVSAGVSYRLLSEKLREIFNVSISHTSLAKWLSGTVSPSDSSMWSKIDSIIKAEESQRKEESDKFSTPVGLTVVRETAVYYNPEKDSASGVSLTEIGKLATISNIAVTTPIKVGFAWSAKSVTVKFRLGALLGAASEHIVLDKDFENLRAGWVVSFAPTDYADHGIFLLFENQKDGDPDYLFGWINTSHPTSIQAGNGLSYDLSDWKVVGYAIAVSWGPGDEKRSIRIEMGGVRPTDRL